MTRTSSFALNRRNLVLDVQIGMGCTFQKMALIRLLLDSLLTRGSDTELH